MKITLYCQSHPNLHLGPSTPSEINFSQGFVTVDTDENPDWEQWVNYGGNTYNIQNLGANEDAQVAPEATSFVCPECGKGFATKFALTGHLRSHAPKEA